MANEWTTYRTRFLIKARQLDAPLSFVDAIGREYSGLKGDYLVQSSDGSERIAPREIFEDIYVPMGQVNESWSALPHPSGAPRPPVHPPARRRPNPGGAFVA